MTYQPIEAKQVEDLSIIEHLELAFNDPVIKIVHILIRMYFDPKFNISENLRCSV